VDVTAAGYGWFVDPTPADDSEFGLGMAGSPAAGRMDLLTVVMHELGHVIGLESRYDGDPSDLMYVYLGTGTRRLPAAADLPAAAIPAIPSMPATSSVAGVNDPGPRVPAGHGLTEAGDSRTHVPVAENTRRFGHPRRGELVGGARRFAPRPPAGDVRRGC
jgi:hypothetical protein